MAPVKRVKIDRIRGNFGAITIRVAKRDGNTGILVTQGEQGFIWADLDSWESVVQSADFLIDAHDQGDAEPQLGKLHRHSPELTQ